MAIDIRAEAARYYDLSPDAPDDIQFYRQRVQSPNATVLELGCGTGRVLVPLARDCGYVHGVDASAAMVSLCQEKLTDAGIPQTRARVEVADITSLCLGRTFDLVTAPYRVFQNLETDEEVEGLFDSVRKHLPPEGTCILNVFRPNPDPATLRREWVTESEYPGWEVPVEGGRITCHARNARMDAEKLILYPELIYRSYRGDELVDEVLMTLTPFCRQGEKPVYCVKEDWHGRRFDSSRRRQATEIV